MTQKNRVESWEKGGKVKKEFLFIGGKLDGRWIPVRIDIFGIPEPFWKIAIRPEYSPVVPINAKIEAALQHTKTVVYRRKQFNCEHKIRYLYIPVNANVIDSFDKLIKGYRKGRTDETINY